MKVRLLALIPVAILATCFVIGCAGKSGDEDVAPTTPASLKSDKTKEASDANPLGEAPKVPE